MTPTRSGRLSRTDTPATWKRPSCSEGDIKGPEWDVLTDPNPPSDWPHFLSTKAGVPDGFQEELEEVLLLERLREVNALIGYTRVEAPEETSSPEERPPMADLSKRRPEWVPATEVHGEGFFVRFREDAVKGWEVKTAVRERERMLMEGHRGWRNARNLPPDDGYPEVRYSMLHTFAHLLIRELSLECGYNAASIRERIYASSDPTSPMAGVLLYTAAADSDGTLGGWSSWGNPTTWDASSDRPSPAPRFAPPIRCAPSTTRERTVPSTRLPVTPAPSWPRPPVSGETGTSIGHCSSELSNAVTRRSSGRRQARMSRPLSGRSPDSDSNCIRSGSPRLPPRSFRCLRRRRLEEPSRVVGPSNVDPKMIGHMERGLARGTDLCRQPRWPRRFVELRRPAALRGAAGAPSNSSGRGRRPRSVPRATVRSRFLRGW